MKHTVFAAVGAACLAAGPLHAVEVNGTTLDLGYSTVSGTNLSKLSFGAAMELGFSPSFAVQLDIGAYDLEALNDNGYNLGAHAIYHLNDVASVGAFVSLDSAAGVDEEFLGIEGAYAFGALSGEAYFSTGGLGGVNADVLGIGVAYALAPQFGVTGSIDRADLDNAAKLTNYALGVTYDPTDSVSLYAEIGTVRASALGVGGSEGFIGVGATFNLGSQRGATFDRRGIFEFAPGL